MVSNNVDPFFLFLLLLQEGVLKIFEWLGFIITDILVNGFPRNEETSTEAVTDAPVTEAPVASDAPTGFEAANEQAFPGAYFYVH
jgi:hypothetical protein